MSNLLIRYYSFLKQRPLVNIVIVIIYYLLVVLPHEEVGKVIARTLDEPLGRDLYNQLILGAGTIGFLGYLWLIKKGIQQFPNRKKVTYFYLLVTFILIILTINILMVINVEMIHFVQYATMAVLLFPLLSSYQETLFVATILGALDEAYQYWVLAPLSHYYDFNDVIINMLGVSLGLILLFSNGIKNKVIAREWFKSPVLVSTLVLLFLFCTLYFCGILAIYPTKEVSPAPLLLVKKIQPEFWTIVHPHVKFHVLRPISGLILTIGLFFLYGKMERYSI